MHNLVLFCKTFIRDLDKMKTLKQSVDKFNADKIPFCIACPEAEIEIFKKHLKTGKEDYELIFLTDEEVAGRELTAKYKDKGWVGQQFIKLLFYKTNVCNFYVILDSDLYFIQDFHISDFMYDESTPYISMTEERKEEYAKIQNYLKRKGKTYGFVRHGQVFSCRLLYDMEENLLNKNNITFEDLLKISPFEMQWYGEYYMIKRPFELYPCNRLFRYFWGEDLYLDAKRRGLTVEDFIKEGCLGILMQTYWIKDNIYKPSLFYVFLRKLRTIPRRTQNFIKNKILRRFKR